MATMDNNSPIISHSRSIHLHETSSTTAQSTTEDECAPFFIDLNSLNESQLDHLRGVGLLPPLPVVDDGITLLNDAEGNEATSSEQILPQLDEAQEQFDPYAIRLLRSSHISYLLNALSNPLSRGFVSLDASHPWMVYWCLHSLDLLGYFDLDAANHESNKTRGSLDSSDVLQDVELMQKGHLLKRVVSTLEACWTDTWVDLPRDDVLGDVRLKQLHENRQMDQQQDAKPFISVQAGGFGGGAAQMPHCAPTYAAVLALSIVTSLGLHDSQQSNQLNPYREAGEWAMQLLSSKRLQLFAFFVSLRVQQPNSQSEQPYTAFRMQHDGEIDVRAIYCLLAPCYLLGLLDNNEASNNSLNQDDRSSSDGQQNINTNLLTSPSISYHIATCQTYEGGFGAEPHNEAHGGYTFCALAALRILNCIHIIDVEALHSWLARRQLGFEGGFCGRTNKLVDGCYSFWQGGALAVLDGWFVENTHSASYSSETAAAPDNASHELTFDELLLQRYILLCAQDVNGGLRDKPSKPRDFYHSCYNLSGLSAAQHVLPTSWPQNVDSGRNNIKFNALFGDKSFNIVGRTDPVINIRAERVQFMLEQKFNTF
jgi:protein farnesyltransferase subunit beta